MKKLLCTIQDTSHMIQIKKRLDQNHINYSVEPIKSNFFSDLVHMIFYRTVVSELSIRMRAAFMWRRILMRRRKR